MLLKRILGATCAVAAIVVLAGCAHANAGSTPPGTLLGTWYEGKTGEPYVFVSDALLVVPHPQAGGGNAVTYRVLDGNKLDILSDGAHRVSFIETLTPTALVLDDPITGAPQKFFRTIQQTQYISSIEASALAAASNFGTITADPTIVWAAPMPTGKGTEWVNWSPSTLDTYATAWDWSQLKRDKTPVAISGGGTASGYSFGFLRKVPTPEEMQQLMVDSTVEATAGLSHIDVGYSASKAKYPAGTLVYLPGGLIYSLGDGFAIGVKLDPKNESFIPATHN